MPVSVICALPALGEQVKVLTHMHVKDDGISLYGFLREEQRRLFEMLIKVSGVGPTNALRMLSVLSEDGLAEAIAAENTAALVRVPGIGTKTAQRVVLELKDKMLLLLRERKTTGDGRIPTPVVADDAIEGLVGLGYSRNDAKKAADAAIGELGDGASITRVITEALRILTKR